MIVVFGSINVDLVARVQRLPQPGETLAGRRFQCCPAARARTRRWQRGAPAAT